MSEERSFQELIDRVRAGDQQAASELMARYEPEIRRAVRVRLTDPKLGRLLDSVDICQSIMANFFLRAAAGQFDLENPEQLLKLLVTMARNRLTDWARRQRADRRDQRRDVSLDAGGSSKKIEVADPAPSPSRVVAGKEILQALQDRLTPEERKIALERAQGKAWADIAKELGEGAEALRKRLSRGLDRVAGELDL